MRYLNNRITILGNGNNNNTTRDNSRLVGIFSDRIRRERELNLVTTAMQGQSFNITNQNLNTLISMTGSTHNGREVLNFVSDPIGEAIQQCSNWRLGRARAPFFNCNASQNLESSLRYQFSRHIGYNNQSNIFRNTFQFSTHNSGNNLNGLPGNLPAVQNSLANSRNGHIVVFNLITPPQNSLNNNSNNNSNNNVAVISFNTFTHTDQRYLDANNIGLNSLPNLRVSTTSNYDFYGSLRPQQMLTNTIIVPESYLNLNLINSIGLNSPANTNAIVSSAVAGRLFGPQPSSGVPNGILPGGGRPYILLDNLAQYCLLIEQFQTAQSQFPNNTCFGRAITLLKDDSRALEQNCVTPFFEIQINALMLLSNPHLSHYQCGLISGAFKKTCTGHDDDNDMLF
jgi:hypothetical protein